MSEDELFELRASVGMVFQEGALFDSMNIRDNVGYQLMERHISDDEVDRRVEESLKFVELDKTMEKFPSELSGGMRRRVAIARAIIAKPSLLLYDSPTGGLDPITSTNIIALVMKQRDVYHTSSILITHRLQDAFMLATHYFDRDKNMMVTLPSGEADRDTSFMLLHEGRLVFDGTTHELVHSDDPFLKEYLS
jgi:phospholipid/cholesterol/gamma-HCH transport system ATP-binding protein